VLRFRRQKRFPAFLAVLLFLGLQTIAAAHELDHALANHDSPACALHLFSDHSGKSLTSSTTFAVAPIVHALSAVSFASCVPCATTVSFQSRAPPRISV
jgi:hypothetical protein